MIFWDLQLNYSQTGVPRKEVGEEVGGEVGEEVYEEAFQILSGQLTF